ncbi:MAG: Dna2/Cas4 domain-containing protein [Hadesarchaea archaeon]|nr:Dna2/Cas4 domain-containing protein [Hadesarchaea archaeon]
MEKIPSLELAYTGTQVNYYFVCKRKLWLFSNSARLEVADSIDDSNDKL